MKKTVVSVATLSALTGVAATAVSADEYKVNSGDTLWGIANEVGTSVQDIKTDNKLENDLIYPGDVLTVNPAEEKEASTPVKEQNTYIVKSGDTLSQIGETFSLDYKEIMKLNNLNSDLIFVGQELKISEAAAETVAVEEVEATEETTDQVADVEVEEPVVAEEPATEEVEVVEETTEEVATEEVATVETEEQVAEVAAAEEAAQEAEAAQIAAEEQAAEVAAAEKAAQEAEAAQIAAEEAAEVAAAEEAAQEEEAAQIAAEEEAAEEAEAAQIAAEEEAAKQAEAERVAEEQAAEEEAAKQAEAERLAAEEAAEEEAAKQAEAERVAAEKAAEEEAAKQAEAERVAEEQAAEEEAAKQAEAERVAAEEAAEEEAAKQAEAERVAAEEEAAKQAEAERVAAEKAAAEAAAAERAEEKAAAQPAAATPSSSVSNGKNWYDWGTCAWYVFERRSDMGLATGNGWGNASNWASAAQSSGYSVGNTPAVGAVMQAPAYTNGSYGQGHVAVVERVNGDGSILVSEMQFGGGLGSKSTRTLSASQAASHNFIY